MTSGKTLFLSFQKAWWQQSYNYEWPWITIKLFFSHLPKTSSKTSQKPFSASSDEFRAQILYQSLMSKKPGKLIINICLKDQEIDKQAPGWLESVWLNIRYIYFIISVRSLYFIWESWHFQVKINHLKEQRRMIDRRKIIWFEDWLSEIIGYKGPFNCFKADNIIVLYKRLFS